MTEARKGLVGPAEVEMGLLGSDDEDVDVDSIKFEDKEMTAEEMAKHKVRQAKKRKDKQAAIDKKKKGDVKTDVAVMGTLAAGAAIGAKITAGGAAAAAAVETADDEEVEAAGGFFSNAIKAVMDD